MKARLVMISSFAVDFLRDLGEVAAAQVFKLECVSRVLSTSVLCVLQVTSEDETKDAQLPQGMCT